MAKRLKRSYERLEAKIQELERELSEKLTIIDGIFDEILLIDPTSFQILDANESFLRNHNLRKEDVIAKKCYEIMTHASEECGSDAHFCPLKQVLETGAAATVEHMHGGENENYFEITSYPIRNNDGKIARIVHVSREITERKELERQSMLKEKQATTIEMAGAMAHELSQPLTNLLVKVELLLEGKNETDPDYHDLRVIFEQALRLEALVKKTRNITRYETKEYLRGIKIVDLEKSSTSKD